MFQVVVTFEVATDKVIDAYLSVQRIFSTLSLPDKIKIINFETTKISK